MSKRYWEPSDFKESEPMRDWVNENVIEALTQFIGEGEAYIRLEDGRLSLTFYSFDMPEKEGMLLDVFKKKFDLIDLVSLYADEWESVAQSSDDGREEVEWIAQKFDDLAAKFRAKAGLVSEEP